MRVRAQLAQDGDTVQSREAGIQHQQGETGAPGQGEGGQSVGRELDPGEGGEPLLQKKCAHRIVFGDQNRIHRFRDPRPSARIPA